MRFSKIVGQYQVKERLIRSVTENRISHTQLFFGPEGSGALALAVAYGQYINCENRTEVDSCGKCPSCIKYEKLVHPDLHFSVPVAKNSERKKEALTDDYLLEWRQAFLANPYMNIIEWMESADLENKQGLISADEANNIIRKISLKAYEAAFKVIIIWQPERMHVSAANKLLKSFEEPPDKTLFILVTEAHDQLLQTILSRSQLIKIPPITDEHINEVLFTLHGLNNQEAKRITHLSSGSYNSALQLLAEDSVVMDFEKDFLQWMRYCYKPSKDIDKLLQWIDQIAQLRREGLKNFLSFSIETVRQCVMMNYGSKELVRFDEDYFTGLGKFAPFILQTNVNGIVEELNKAYYHIERNANPKILFLDLSLKIHKLIRIAEAKK